MEEALCDCFCTMNPTTVRVAPKSVTRTPIAQNHSVPFVGSGCTKDWPLKYCMPKRFEIKASASKPIAGDML